MDPKVTLKFACAFCSKRCWTSSFVLPKYPLSSQIRLQSTTKIESKQGGKIVVEKMIDRGKRVQLTSETYPSMKRNMKFAKVTSNDVKFFESLLGNDTALINGLSKNLDDEVRPYNQDWMHKYQGQSKLVLKPKSTEEVSKILKYCNENMLAVVPQGGNTGLVGGSVPVFDEIIVHLGRMNKIWSFDETSGVLVADAGCILQITEDYLKERNYIFPLDLGAKGSCHIGGNVSTNAGGLRLLRYGSLHGNVLGIEAVLPDGTIVDDLSVMRKNNTGYNIKNLFIGAEGTLGIITRISVVCPRRPNAVNVAYFGLESYEKVQDAFKEAKHQLFEILSAFEFMDGQSQDVVFDVTRNQRPLESRHPFYCLIETSGSNSEHDNDKLSKFSEIVLDKGIVSDGVLANGESQIKNLWDWRERVPDCLGYWGGVYKYDLSIPISDLYTLVDEVRNRIKEVDLIGDTAGYPVVSVVGYGHMGDSNLHLNIATRRYDRRVEEILEPFVFEWVGKHNGSISAEHGLGLAKKNYIRYSRNDTMIQLMKQIKSLYDPNGIMNPYKYI